jgi:hypothetical protein
MSTLAQVIEREAPPPSTVDDGRPVAPQGGIPAPRAPADDALEHLSPLAIFGVVLTVILSLSWFFFSWLALSSPVTDAIGETVGSLAVVLLLVSVIGAARRH